MAIVKRILARSTADLEAISWRSHDGELEPESVAFDAQRHEVILTFVQEPHDIEEGLPASAHVRSTRFFDEFAVPFLRYTLRVRAATALRVPDGIDEHPELLLSVDQPEDGVVQVETDCGRIEVDVLRLDVELAISDGVESVRRRRVGQNWNSTAPWPPDRLIAMHALVLRGDSPPPLDTLRRRRPA